MHYTEVLEIYHYILLGLCVFFCYGVYIHANKRKFKLPPGPRGLPLVGILPFLSDKPHLDFMKWSKKYGDIFSVHLARNLVVVVTDADLGIQLLSKAIDRPPDIFHSLPDGAGFSELNGAEWMKQRRFAIMQLKNLDYGQSRWEKIVQMDISDILEILDQSRGEPLDIQEPLSLTLSNNILSLLTNRRISKEDPRRAIIENGVNSFQHLHAQTSLITFYPKLFHFAVKVGLLNVSDKLKDLINMNKFIRQEVEEIKEHRGDDTFIDKYLNEIENYKQQNKETSFNDTTLLGNVQAFLLAGSHTIRISIQYLLLAMAAYPEVQAKVHQELDTLLGKDGSIEWTKRKMLPYCYATILEGQRWRTVAPLNVVRRASEDIEINGYNVPKGTDIITVLWAFHHDTKYWKHPETFDPSRFLSDEGKTVEEPKVFIPFSHGKRMCPGKLVALIQTFQYFLSIMQKFKVLPASELSQLNLDGNLGLSLIPKRQELRFATR